MVVTIRGETRVVDVAVLEPREVVRLGLATMLRTIGGVNRLECHCDLDDLVAHRALDGGREPDIVIVSDQVSDLVRGKLAKARVLEVIDSTDSRDIATATKTQADGYLVLPDITEAVLDRALQALMLGELPMPVPVANYLLENVRSTKTATPRVQPYFSPREHDVIDLLLEGLSNTQIAQKLGISLHSAKRHVSSVLHKTNSPSRTHFVAWRLRGDG
jgi:two-component system nitrate/nitrite response regulator NarL